MNSGLRIRELRLAGVPGGHQSYGVRFTDKKGQLRPLSVIAGPSQTGKTSVADFVRYCLGGTEHPQHPEILEAVRAALLEVELDGKTIVIERAAVGSPSSFASVWEHPLGEIGEHRARRVSTEPTSDPEGLSQLVLAGFGLDGVALPEAPTKDGSRTQLLSIRDVFRVVFLLNERLDNKDLAFERSNHMVRQKFRQLIDAIFGVYDPDGARLTSSIQAATEAVNEARREEKALTDLATDEFPGGLVEANLALEQADAAIGAAETELVRLDALRRTADGSIVDLRVKLEQAQRAASDAQVRLRDRISLLARLSALRAQYADDKKKLTFLTEAERLFDPLNVTTCPACLSALEASPAVTNDQCSLCGSDVAVAGAPDVGLTAAHGGDSAEGPLMAAELRAVSRRLKELNEYWERLDRDRARLERVREGAERAASHAAESIDKVAKAPAPWLAARDGLTERIAEARLNAQEARAGVRLWQRVSDVQGRLARLELTAKRLRAQKQASSNRPDRRAIIQQLSGRFGSILADFGYPKLAGAIIDDNLVPQVRGLNYTAASSGGLVLISLAFHLAIWELAFELNGAAPGVLVIDSPQKNLGHSADTSDPDFADSRLVENFYRHVVGWLEHAGAGAQLIVIDNSPPESVADFVVAHYTRDPSVPPYGLITDAVD